MNSFERFMCAVAGNEADRVPVAPYMGNFGAAVAGVKTDAFCRSGKTMADAQIRAWEQLGQDALVAQSDNYYIAEGFGLEVEHHDNGTPTITRHPIQDMTDIESLQVPDPLTDGRMPVYLEAIERMASAFKGEVIIRAPGTGPFSLAGHLMGTEEFVVRLAMLGLEPDPDEEHLLRRLMEKTTEALIRFEMACIDAGADVVQAGDSSASIDLISPDLYEKWAFPYEKRFFDTLNPYARERGAVTLLHICGDMTPMLDMEAETGAMIVEIDSKVDLGEAKRRIGDQTCLMGNIEPSAVLLSGTPCDVALHSEDAIAKAAHGGGFVLGSGCEVPPRAPFENLARMVEVAKSARYPLQS